MDKNINNLDKAGQASVDIVSYAATFALGGALIGLGLATGWLILAMIVMSVAITAISMYVNDKFFSLVKKRSRTLEA